jgi:uncharacterized protein
VVEKIITKTGKNIEQIMGNTSFLRGLNATDFVTDKADLPTVKDILQDLEKPGRDPRPEFKSADFMEGVTEIRDLTPGMILEGAVTNVTNFGAFVDVGVHQDGLVHISMLSNTFVKDPHSVVKTGDVVRVKVLEVDEKRKRISLTMRLDDKPQPAAAGSAGSAGRGQHSGKPAQPKRVPEPAAKGPGSFGSLLQDALHKR